jgi:two-component SAPR family response regulator
MKTVIVDDEELACKRLSGMLTELPDIEVCGTFGTALEALQYIEKNPVEVVFMDISMPEMDGMKLANQLLDKDDTVQIVFVTGYEEYAVEAFALDAADYLLKPISQERLAKTLKRLKGSGMSNIQRLRITCFGGFHITTESGEIVRWRTPKVEELFAYLIYRRSASREQIIDTLWGGLDPDKALRNLNTTLYYVRKSLQKYGLEECVTTRNRQISVNTDKLYCDLYEFEALQRTKVGCRLEEIWEHVGALYTGELYSGKTYEWSFAIARRLEAEYLSVLLDIARRKESQNQTETAVRLYQRALELDWSGEAYDRLMNIYTSTGQLRQKEQLQKIMSRLWLDKPGLL